MAKLLGAAKKMKAALVEELGSNIEDVQRAKFVREQLSVLKAIEDDQEVTLMLTKEDKSNETPKKLTFVKFNTANKMTAVNEAGEEVALIRTNIGKSLPKENSNVWRISNTTARYEVLA